MTNELFVWLRRQSGFIRQFVPRGIRHRIPGFGRFIQSPSSFADDDDYLLTRNDTKFRINRSDYVQWRLFYGVRDHALKEAMRLLNNDCVVVDIGANFGAFSLRVAKEAQRKGLRAKVHAFEPNALIRNRFEANVALNPELTSFIVLHPVGLGAETAQRSFIIPSNNSGAARIVALGADGAKVVNIRALDDISFGHRVVFIKLIAGGFEGEIFKGAWRTIETHRPVIFFEVTVKWYQEHDTSLDEIIRRLTSLGYSFMGELKNELLPYDRKIFAEVDQYYILARC